MSLWAYITLGATSIFTEEAAPVVAGFAAHQGHLGAIRVALACALGSWWADIALYSLGRSHAASLMRRWPKLRRPMIRLLVAVRKRPWHAALIVRFAYGARLTLPITCGAARLPFWLYVVGSGISAFVWSFMFTALGWGFGETAVRLLGRIKRYEFRIGIGLLVVLIVIGVVLSRRARAANLKMGGVEEEVDPGRGGRTAIE